jgi:hypothetical protein
MSGGPSEASPISLYIGAYDEHDPIDRRYVVWGGADEDTYVAEFQTREAAQFFIDMSKKRGVHHKGIRGSP